MGEFNGTMKKQFKHERVDGKRVARIVLLAILDAGSVALAYFLALLIRFEFDVSSIGQAYIYDYQVLIIPYILIAIASMWTFRLYHSIWTYASTTELVHLVYSWVVIQVGILGRLPSYPNSYAAFVLDHGSHSGFFLYDRPEIWISISAYDARARTRQ